MGVADTAVEISVALVALALVGIPLGLNQLYEVSLHADIDSSIVTIIETAIPAVLFVSVVIVGLKMMSS